MPTYQSAWLKTHHPAAFLAGVLTHDPGMYPKRLILDEARHFGIDVLGLDVNRSDAVYRIEPVPDAASGFGIRMALAEVKGIAQDELDRIVAGRPYADLTDFWWRARVARPVVERLLLAGAFDAVSGIAGDGRGVRHRSRITRRDLLLRIADLDRLARSTTTRRSSTGQLAFDLPLDDHGQGLPEMTPTERVRAELDVLGLDVSRHVVDFYAPLLRALGVTPARELLDRRSRTEVLVAGVKVATQTPPVRSGRRVVFLTLDDSTGPIDLAFFDDVQGEITGRVFDGWLLLARGVIRRTGPRGLSLRATGAWDLTLLQRQAQEHGVDSVLALLETTPRPGDAGVEEQAGPRRVLLHPSGYRQSPYADLKPAGTEVADTRRALPSRALWHTSPGSPGRGA
jgi:error-prone DNA polymerase